MTGRVLVLTLGAAAAVLGATMQTGDTPRARAHVWATLEERDLVLEGTAWDPSTRSVLVGSLHKNKIIAIALDGSVSERVPARSHGLASVAGIHVDTLSRTLWVTSNARYDQPTDTTRSALFAFDAATGAFKARYDLPGAGRNFLNDLTTARDGTVYATGARRVWRLRPNQRLLEEFAAAGQFARPNGITISDDGRHLFVADEEFVRAVSLETGESWRVATPDSLSAADIDGLAFVGNSLIGHHPGQSPRLVRYTLDASRRTITGGDLLEANTADLRTSTTGEIVNGEYVFIGNGQIDRMNNGTIDFATMQPIRMYRVSLGPPAEERVVVALSARDSVAVLDGQTLQRIATLPVGHNPHEIASSADGAFAYVADAGDTTITVVALTGTPRVHATWALPDSMRVHDVAVTGDGRYVWATSGQQQMVLQLEARSGRVIRQYRLQRPGNWLIDTGGPAGDIIVAHLEGGAVTLLNPTTGAERVFSLREGQIDAVATLDSATVWSVNLNDSTVTVLDGRTGAILDRQISGAHAVRVIMTPDRRSALTVNDGDSTVVKFDVRSRRRVGAVKLGATPKVIALSTDGRRGYVTHPERNAVTLFDVASMTVLRMEAVAGGPDGVAYGGPPSPFKR